MKIATIVGARPQFIKAASVTRLINPEPGITEVIIHTGQHYDNNMSNVFFEELNLPKPNYNLGVRSGNHGEQTGIMLINIEKTLLKERPDLVLVYGDTNSTLAGALAASKLHIPIAHIEAGLRSFNKSMAEETNRMLTDHMSDILFVPTVAAIKNLKDEGITDGVYNVGDVMFDAAFNIKDSVDEKEILSGYNLGTKNFVLTTIHRPENTDLRKNLENIWDALLEICKKGIKVFFPVHPRTKKELKRNGFLEGNLPTHLILHPPISYKDMIVLENNAKIIVTDSGGVQKEGYFFKVPCIIPREETEWIELVENGWTFLVGPDMNRIVKCTLKLWKEDFSREWKSFYGNGDASKKIIMILKEYGKLKGLIQ